MNTFNRTQRIAFAGLLLWFGVIAYAHAGETDACTVKLCMYGKLTMPYF
ncbi:hypothetical protein ALP74_200151 [Pseudomonas coronafaciens pv. garcae]|uniref:Uncharacterized protein n=1 Tax=Pseudomonas coronafaciens pv. garcae TaxID=251653 RepID=A0AB37QR37_9PSED|nr:hypothetical protein ALP74_200151 [Pseudomonas coronafaciens pv. garcae]